MNKKQKIKINIYSMIFYTQISDCINIIILIYLKYEIKQ